MKKRYRRIIAIFILTLLALGTYNSLTSNNNQPTPWGLGDASQLEIQNARFRFVAIIKRWQKARENFDSTNNSLKSAFFPKEPLPEAAYDEYLVLDTNAGTVHLERNGAPVPGHEFALPQGLTHRLYHVTNEKTQLLQGVIRLRHHGIDQKYNEKFWLIGEGRNIGMALGFGYRNTTTSYRTKGGAKVATPKYGQSPTQMNMTIGSGGGGLTKIVQMHRRIDGKLVPVDTPRPTYHTAIVDDKFYAQLRQQAAAYTHPKVAWHTEPDKKLDANRNDWLTSLPHILQATQQAIGDLQFGGGIVFDHNPAYTGFNIVALLQSKPTFLSRIPFFPQAPRYANLNLKADRIAPGTWYAHSDNQYPSNIQPAPGAKLQPIGFVTRVDSDNPYTDSKESLANGQAFLEELHKTRWEIQIDQNTRFVIHGIGRFRGPADTWWGPDGSALTPRPYYLHHYWHTTQEEHENFRVAAGIIAKEEIHVKHKEVQRKTANNGDYFIGQYGTWTLITKTTNHYQHHSTFKYTYQDPPEKITSRFALENQVTGQTRWVRLENVSLTPGKNFDFKMILEPQSP